MLAARVGFILGAKSSRVQGSPGAVSRALPETPRLPGPLPPAPLRTASGSLPVAGGGVPAALPAHAGRAL